MSVLMSVVSLQLVRRSRGVGRSYAQVVADRPYPLVLVVVVMNLEEELRPRPIST